MYQTPKCHPEVAVEGIDSNWAQSKIYMRYVPINKRSSIEHFRNNLRLALNDGDGENLSRVKVKSFQHVHAIILQHIIYLHRKKTMIKLTQNY